MIFVDTSVWIEFFRGKNQGVVNRLRYLLDSDLVVLSDVVYLELINGVKLIELNKLTRVLSALPRIEIGQENIKLIEQWLLEPKNKSYSFGVGDLLIASSVYLTEGELWTLDKDFQYMKKLGFIQLLSH